MCNTRYSALMLECFLKIERPFYQVFMYLCLRDEDITQVLYTDRILYIYAAVVLWLKGIDTFPQSTVVVGSLRALVR